MNSSRAWKLLLALTVVLLWAAVARAQVVINEIHYHPLVIPFFTTTGAPVINFDVTQPDGSVQHDVDLHEFVELRNTTGSPIDLSGWTLSNAISYTFPTGTTIAANGYIVIAKDKTRLAAVTAYGLTVSGIQGPYSGQLSNKGDTISLKNSSGNLIDSVSYSSSFPWAMTANALGADKDWTKIDPLPYQYRGRSLERVSDTADSNDPANWIASPLAAGPSPGRVNSTVRAIPQPVVGALRAYQASNESTLIRASQTVRVDLTFTSTASLSNVRLEYFIDNIDATNETHTFVTMTDLGSGQYTANIPGQADRSVVRYRVLANRGSGDEVVSPRPDDPKVVPAAGGTREAWNAYFVTPVRTLTSGTNGINGTSRNSAQAYDIFVANADIGTPGVYDGTKTLSANIWPYGNGIQPRRVLSDSAGTPRADAPYDATGTPFFTAPTSQWNGAVPGVFCWNGQVWDVQFRYHGSRYRRAESRQSYKIQFPDFAPFQDQAEIFETDKDEYTIWGQQLHREMGLPSAYTKWVDLYINSVAKVQRLEQSLQNDDLINLFFNEWKTRNPSFNIPEPGEAYKAKGTDEGPFGNGNGSLLNTKGTWQPWMRYYYTYPIQSHKWKGSTTFKAMFDSLWAARGDAASPGTNTNVAALRTYLNANWDIDKALTYLALRNWECVWDDTIHNHYLWQQADGKWCILPWDFDSEFASQPYNTSIYNGEIGNPTGRVHYLKDSLIKAFRTEYKQKLFILNNTLLSAGTQIPGNLSNLGINVDQTWVANRNADVNTQLGLGTFYKPDKPTNVSPASGGSALPPTNLTTSTYNNGNPTPRAHASTIWEIRASTGTYRAPVYKLSSSTNLTSLAIPFASLTLGQTYYWRVTYVDEDGHPSLPSDESSFTYGLVQAPPISVIAVDANTQWKYFQTGNPGSTWRLKTFSDTAWPSGAAVLSGGATGLPDTVRTSLTVTSGRITYYFRTHFDFPYSPQGVNLKLKLLVDDGAVVYLNGTEIYRVGMNTGAVTDTTTANRSISVAAYEGPVTIANPASLVQGDNVIAVEVHQNIGTSPDITFGLTLDASITNVVLNEVMANNHSAVANGSTFPDWIELYNGGSQAVDLGGMSLSDDVSVPGKYVFPAGTIVPALGYVVVWCDSNTSTPGLHAGFGLDKGGQTIALFGSNGAVKDFITFGPQARDLSIGRSVNGSGSWTLCSPTAGSGNTTLAASGLASGLRLNEWMARPSTGSDWFEIYNPGANPVDMSGLWLSDTAGTPKITQLPALSYIAPAGYADFTADGSVVGASHVNFSLNGSTGDSLILSDTAGGTVIDSVSFGSQTEDVSQGRLPDGSTNITAFVGTSSRAQSNWVQLSSVVINEALTASTPPAEDVIELANLTASPVNIGGWWLSDTQGSFKKYQIPAGTTIPANGFLTITETQFGGTFSLDSTNGDDIYLSAVDGGGALTGFRSEVHFGAAETGVTFGRVARTGGFDFFPASAPTLGTANASPKIGPVILNEIMYHPPDVNAADNVDDEFIEIHNTSTSPVSLYDPSNPTNCWRLRQAVDFTFPVNTVLLPSDYILIVSFNPAVDTAKLAAFKAKYSVPSDTAIYGPYSGKLNNSSDSIELVKPLPPVGGVVPWVLVDHVDYADNTPWPAIADGAGSSLQRKSRTAYGNDAANWEANSSMKATAGVANISEPAITDSDGDGLPDSYEVQYGLNRKVAGDQLLDSDGDGQSNWSEYLAGTDPLSAVSVLNAQVIVGGSAVTVRFTAMPNKSYTVQYTTNLQSGTWLKLSDVAAQSGAPRTLDVTDNSPGGGSRFYRVVTPQQP